MHGRAKDEEIVHGGLFVRQPHQTSRIIGNDEIIHQEVMAGLSDPPRQGNAGEEETESSQLGLGFIQSQHSLCTGKLGELGVVTAIFQSEIISKPLNFASNISHWNWVFTSNREFCLCFLSCHSPSAMHSSSEKNSSQRNQHQTQPSSRGSTGRRKI